LAPIWEELAYETKRRVNIGSVDCTVHKSDKSINLDVCQKYQVAGYPTLIYINDEAKTTFSGSRDLHSLKNFALGIVKKPSFQVIPADEIQATIKSSPAVLFYVYNGNSTQEVKSFDMVYDSFKAVKGKIKVVVCPDKDGYKVLGLEKVPNSPTLVIYRDSGIDYDLYSGNFDDTSINRENMQHWILTNRHPLVPELDEATQIELTKVLLMN
jgi:thioredoxin domain-containing protein 5